MWLGEKRLVTYAGKTYVVLVMPDSEMREDLPSPGKISGQVVYGLGYQQDDKNMNPCKIYWQTTAAVPSGDPHNARDWHTAAFVEQLTN